jgi:hypothetical protein
VDAQLLDSEASSLFFALRVAAADGDRCAELIAQVNRRLVESDGFVSLDVIRREGGLGTDFYVIARFATAEALENWRADEERKALLDEVETLAITDVSRQQASGSNIWFEPVSSLPTVPKPPPLWKRWVTSMLAVYPALVVLVALMKPVTSRLPEALGLFLVAFTLTGLTTAFIVPWLTRTLHGWLTRR